MTALLERIAALSPEKRQLLVQRLDPLSLVQEPVWFLHRFAPDVPAYNIPLALAVSGPLDPRRLERTMRTITARHEILRTTFPAIDGQPVQLVAPDADVALPMIDLGEVAADRVEAFQQRLLDQESRRVFDIERGPLWRCLLLRRSADEHVLMLTVHHLIFDGWSRGVLLAELAMCYDAYSHDRAPILPSLPIQYRHYARWHRDRLDDDEFDGQVAYWREQLGGELPLLDLPSDRPRPPHFSYRGADIMFSVPPELTNELRTLARDRGVTLFMVLLAAWTLLLHRYSGQRDIIVGTATSGRTRRDVEDLIGCFVNALPLRVSLAGNPTVDELLARVKEVALGAYAHQDIPFERLVAELQPERRLDRSAIFSTSLMLMNTPPIAVGGGGGLPLRVRELTVADRAARFDLALGLMETPDGLLGPLRYATDLFDRSTMVRLLGHLTHLLAGMTASPERRVSELPLVSALESEEIERWNATSRVWSSSSLSELLTGPALHEPDRVAISDHEGSWTYRDVHDRANRIARWLRTQGIGAGARVGLCLGRSRHAITAVLATLQAGAAYVPLEPTSPSGRLVFQLTDAGVAIVFTDREHAASVPSGSYAVHPLDDDDARWAGESAEPLRVAVDPEELAYIIYTSGSTGQPKGVMVTRGGLLNYLCWARDTYPLAEGHGTLFHTSLAFDLTVTSVLAPLIVGAAIRIVPEGGGVEALVEAFRANDDLAFVKATPSHLHALDAALGADVSVRTRALVVGGEALDSAIVKRWLIRAPHSAIYNEYGPTETVVGCSVEKIVAGYPTADPVPIGRPIANTRLYVVSAEGQLAPVGIAGELWIGGAGVARGYLNRPDLTAERFVPDPFGATPGERLYRSGDRVRWRADGVLEYLGRADHQVKLRGHRIELGEIESALRQQAGVRDAVVVLREDVPGERRLVAYVVAAPGAGQSVDALQRALRAQLPDAMVPAAIVWLDALPLTANGKVDRRQLRAPGAERPTLTEAFVAPRTPIETTLARIWAAVLRLDRVGVHDNFFALGGDSIVSLQIVARANEAGVRILPRQVFEHQTIAALARAVHVVSETHAEQGPLVGPVPLLPMQRRYFGTNRPAPHHYNQQVRLELAPQAPVAVLDTAWSTIVRHHDALRFRFTGTGDGWTQTSVTDEGGERVPRIDLTAVAEADQIRVQHRVATAVQAGLDLTRGPVARVVLFMLPGPALHALFVVHHLVVDGVSWRVLLMDFQDVCEQLQRGRTAVLPPKTSSVREWAEGLRELANSGTLDGEIPIWTAMSAPATALPRDFEHGANSVRSVAAHVDALGEEETRALLQELPARGVGHVDELLLTALVQALASWGGGDTWRVDLEGHGREDVSEALDVSRTVGWLTSLYPVRLSAQSDPLATLRGVKTGLRAIPRHGLGYGVLRYLDDRAVTAPIRDAAPADIIFNYLGQTAQVLAPTGWARPAAGPVGVPYDTRQPREHLFEITGIVVDGRMQLSLAYSAEIHRRETVEALMTRFTGALRALVASSREATALGRWLAPADFPLADVTQQEIDTLASRGRVADVYPLSPMQEGLLFHTVYEAASSLLYTVRYRAYIEGPLDPAAFERAWQTVVARHDILRTAFLWNRAGRPLQVVYDVAVPCAIEDWRHVPPSEREARLADALRDDERQGFTLEHAPLMRVALRRLDEARWHAAWTLHHLITDGWSVQLVFAEVLAVYTALVANQPVPDIPAGRYREYVGWLRGQDLAKAEAFWRRSLDGLAAPTLLAGDVTAPAHATVATRSIHAVLSPSLTASLQQLGRVRSLTMNTWLVGAWALLLAQRTGRRDVVFGTVVSGRPAQLADIERTPGMFVNTLPVRATLTAHEPIGTWLGRLQAAQTEAREYEYTPLGQIQSWSAIAPPAPLFDTLFAYENYPIAPPRDDNDTGIRVIRSDSELVIPTTYPVVLEFAPSSEAVGIRMTFDTARVPETTAEEILARFQALVERMAGAPDASIDSLIDALDAIDATARAREREQADERHQARLKTLTQKIRRPGL